MRFRINKRHHIWLSMTHITSNDRVCTRTCSLTDTVVAVCNSHRTTARTCPTATRPTRTVTAPATSATATATILRSTEFNRRTSSLNWKLENYSKRNGVFATTSLAGSWIGILILSYGTTHIMIPLTTATTNRTPIM